jgi:glutathione S-transferase
LAAQNNRRITSAQSDNSMHYVHLTATLAVLQFFFFGIMVGRARARFGVKAPATTGNEHFERAFRVQMNTLEQLAGFLPALYIASQFWPARYVAAIGVVYLVGRIVYWRSYIAEPNSRGLGFLLTVSPTFVLLIAAVIGAVSRIAASAV